MKVNNLFVATFLVISLGCKSNTFRVERVIDGETMVLSNGERVRYIGIDTPEMRPLEYYAEEATKANRNLVEGKKVRLEYDVEKRESTGCLLTSNFFTNFLYYFLTST